MSLGVNGHEMFDKVANAADNALAAVATDKIAVFIDRVAWRHWFARELADLYWLWFDLGHVC